MMNRLPLSKKRFPQRILFVVVVLAIFHVVYDTFLTTPYPSSLSEDHVFYTKNHNQQYSFQNPSIITQSSFQNNRTNIKILFYITTHWSEQHQAFLEFCWPEALQHSQLLRISDVAIFVTANTTSDGYDLTRIQSTIRRTFYNKNVTIYHYGSAGYQDGAIAALVEADNNGYFNGYDWIIRLNPDVLIQDDTWILQTIYDNNNTTSLVYVNCWEKESNVTMVHTDFFMLKPTSIRRGALNQTNNSNKQSTINAEKSFTEAVWPLFESNQTAHVPNARPKKWHRCRVNNHPSKGTIVQHFHHYPIVTMKKYFQHVPLIKRYICPATFVTTTST
jgi:hypothetical protein